MLLPKRHASSRLLLQCAEACFLYVDISSIPIASVSCYDKLHNDTRRKEYS